MYVNQNLYSAGLSSSEEGVDSNHTFLVGSLLDFTSNIFKHLIWYLFQNYKAPLWFLPKRHDQPIITRVSLQAENWGQPLGGTDFLLSNEGRNGPND